MVGAVGLFVDGERPLEGGLGLGEIALLPEHQAQVVDADRYLGVVGTEGCLGGGASSSMICALCPFGVGQV
jgi:hypothetical protein